MRVKEAIRKYHKLVPFPWNPRKIKKAGFSPPELLITFGRDLERCEDADTPEGKALMSMINELELMGG